MATYFDIPYEKRGQAKRAGATFDEEWHRWKVDGPIPQELKHWRHVTFDGAANIGIYGGRSIFDKSRAFRPLIVRVLHCEHIESCPLAKGGTCVTVTDPSLRKGCPWAYEQRLDQHKKDYKFSERIHQMSAYDALSTPHNIHFAHVGNDHVFIDLKYIRLEFDPEHKTEEKRSGTTAPVPRAKSDPDMILEQSSFGFHDAVIPRERLTPELLAEIANMKAWTWLTRDRITEYNTTVIPRLLDEIRQGDPDLYERYCTLVGVPEQPSQVGRRALLSTCRQGATWETSHGIVRLEGDALIGDDWSDSYVVPGMKSFKHGRISIPVTDTTIVEITDNAQVSPDTKFV